MPLINPLPYLLRARKHGVALPHFNFSNLDTLQGIVMAAEALRTPVMLATSPGAVRHIGMNYIAACAKAAAEEASVPIALHMDHCMEMDMLRACVKAGYTSLMLETGHYDYDGNVRAMREAVAIARDAGCAIEGELGRIGGAEDDLSVDEREAALTVPDEARDYVAKTGVDALAVSIGTAHGAYKLPPKLDFDRLSSIRARVDVPLVLHGASGVPDGDVRRAIGLGIAKVNIATELKAPYAGALLANIKDVGDDPRAYGMAARLAVRDACMDKIRLFGADGLCDLED